MSGLELRSVEHLTRLLGVSREWLERFAARPARHYDRRLVAVKGKNRRLAVPRPRLRDALDRLQARLQTVVLPETLHGGRRGRSVVTNALPHCRQPVVIRLDIADFFPGVSHRRVYTAFAEGQRCAPDVARHLTRLTTLDGCLPQGSPTSPMVANLVAAPLARRLERLAAQHGARYTQYVDDITLSGPRHLERLLPLVTNIVRQEGFTVNPSKTAVLPASTEQIVTGVRVDGGLAAPASTLREIDDLLARAVPDDVARLRGKIAYVHQLDRARAAGLTTRLEAALRAPPRA
jgi:hypothetical protein